jgi:hypothetical protein
MPRPKRKTVAVLIAMVIVGTGAGLAYAYWTSDGTGSGTAATGTSQAVVINQTSTISGMGPEVAAQELSGTFDNPGPSEATVTTVTASISSISGAGPGGCEADDYVITGAAMTVTGNPIAVGDDVGAWGGATIAFLSSDTENQDGCKGATVNLAYVAS